MTAAPREMSWEAARRRIVNAGMKLAAAYEKGTDREPALRDFQRASLDLAALGVGLNPDAELWDPDRSRQLDLELAERERARR